MPKAACADYWHRVRTLARVRWPPFVVLCLGLYALNALRANAFLPPDHPLRNWFWLDHATTLAIGGLFMYAALVLSEALALRGIRHAVVTVVALAAGLVGAVGLMGAMGRGEFGDLSWLVVLNHQLVPHWEFTLRFFWLYFAAALLLAAYVAVEEREANAARLAEQTQAERANAERATVAARLKVMQARVEPELLFGVLNEARARYVRSPVEGDALLEDLIAYLRAALPQMRGDGSTVGREVELATAYAGIAPRHDGRRVDVVVSLDDRDAGRRFPPMVLLPLVRAAASGPCRRIGIAIAGPSMRITVRIEPEPGPTVWSDDLLAPVRATLIHYFGASASLSTTGGSATVAWD